MENNQQNRGARNTSTKEEATSFSNQQPGQQLPSKNEAPTNTNQKESRSEERHSESSKPEAENETLGTP